MKIAVRVPFVDENIKKRLTKTAESVGYEIKFLGMDAEPTLDDIGDCNILFGKFPAGIIKDVKELKWLQLPSAGANGFTDDSIYPNNDVILTNGSGAYGVTIAEYQVMMLLMMMRMAPQYIEGQKTARWKNLGAVRSIFGSRILVVGTGNLGGEFAKRVKAFGAHVVGVRKNGNKPEEGFDEMYNIADIDAQLSLADVVALNLPGTNDTTGIMTKERINSLKSDAILMNVGRGTAIDQDALNEALREHKIAGALLDVTNPEPLPAEHPLWTAPNILITPHVSGNYSLQHTCDVLLNIFETNLLKFAKGEPLDNVVDRKAGY